MFKFDCPVCTIPGEYQAQQRGLITKCRNCGETIRLPGESGNASKLAPKGITQCPDCGGKISVKALTCPHCGCPFQQNQQMHAAVIRSAASSPDSPKSFVGAAVVTFVLYWFIWIPGVVANFLYLGEARREKQRCKKNPEGFAFLLFMYWFFFWGPIIVGCFWFLVFVIAAALNSWSR